MGSAGFDQSARSYVGAMQILPSTAADRAMGIDDIDVLENNVHAGTKYLARLRGLDPDVWFNDVELVVAAKVGGEPVGYVGNIYRYYIAYKRALAVYDIEKEAGNAN